MRNSTIKFFRGGRAFIVPEPRARLSFVRKCMFGKGRRWQPARGFWYALAVRKGAK
jgi:hypothetical protein